MSHDRLLQLFDPDPRKAEIRLEQLRKKLVSYFTWRHITDAEHLANEVLLRAVRRISAGTPLDHDDPTRFIYGIARKVLLEARRTDQRRALEDSIDDYADAFRAPSAPEDRQFLREALASLAPDERRVLIAYCQEDSAGRNALAARLGKSPAALRVQICHMRDRLKKWRCGNV